MGVNRVVNYYNQFDEWGRLDREPIEFKVNWHYINRYLPAGGRILDNGAGPGKYSMKLAEKGFRVTVTDLTPRFVRMAEERAEELGLRTQFDGFYAADARWLSELDDHQFDAVLMLGPMYHLQEEPDRIQAVKELYRVTKAEGIVFVAFMPRQRHMLSSLLAPENWKPNHSSHKIKEFMQTGCFNHEDAGRFTGAYYFNIEEIQPFMERQGFEPLALIGSNVGTFLSGEALTYWRDKGEEEKITDLLIDKASDPYLLGASSHLLYIGKKKL